MNDALSELIAILPPPATPEENHGDWNAAEKQLGASLPADYKAFVETYGSGMMATDPIGGELSIYCPFSRNKFMNLASRVEGLAEYVRTAKGETFSGQFVPFPRGDLLQWGQGLDGDMAFWRMRGDADRWTVVFYDWCKAVWSEHRSLGFIGFLLAPGRAMYIPNGSRTAKSSF